MANHEAIARNDRLARRKKRREAVLLTLLGVAFAAVGVFLLLVVKNPWMGAMGVCFGIMAILTGLVEARERTTLVTDIMLTVSSLMFAATGALMLISGILAPESWGWRNGGAIISGALCLAFFGPGTVILIIVTIRRHRARSRIL